MSTTLPNPTLTGTWVIDPSHSEAGFTTRHAGIAKVRGSIAITEGTIVVGDSLETSSVTAVLDAATIDTRDANRDGHLRSADFFDVENFPTWTFTSTSVAPKGSDYVLTGELAIHGVAKTVDLDLEFNGTATDPFGNARAGFSASTEISRKDFGLTWNAALETGGFLVSDNVKVSLEISTIRQA